MPNSGTKERDEEVAVVWRAWLDTGRYVLVDAATEPEARRKLTRTQRKRLVRLVPTT